MITEEPERPKSWRFRADEDLHALGRSRRVEQPDQRLLVSPGLEAARGRARGRRAPSRPPAGWRWPRTIRSRSCPRRAQAAQAGLDHLARSSSSSSARCSLELGARSRRAPRRACGRAGGRSGSWWPRPAPTAVTPSGTSMHAGSRPAPSSVTITTRARPGPRAHELDVLERPLGLRRDHDAGAARQAGQHASSPRSAPPRSCGRRRRTGLDAGAARPRDSRPPPAGRRRTGAGPRRSAAGRPWCAARTAGPAPQVLHDVADRGRRQLAAEPARQRARADRLAGLHVGSRRCGGRSRGALVQVGEHGLRQPAAVMLASVVMARRTCRKPPNRFNQGRSAAGRRGRRA